MANGDPLQILGQTQSHIHLAGTDFTHNVLVSGNVTQDCLLGADFLAAHGFVIDLQSRVLRQGQASTPLLHQPESTLPVCRVTVSDTVIVRAGEENCFLPMLIIPLVLTLQVLLVSLNPRKVLKSVTSCCWPEL